MARSTKCRLPAKPAEMGDLGRRARSANVPRQPLPSATLLGLSTNGRRLCLLLLAASLLNSAQSTPSLSRSGRASLRVEWAKTFPAWTADTTSAELTDGLTETPIDTRMER